MRMTFCYFFILIFVFLGGGCCYFSDCNESAKNQFITQFYKKNQNHLHSANFLFDIPEKNSSLNIRCEMPDKFRIDRISGESSDVITINGTSGKHFSTGKSIEFLPKWKIDMVKLMITTITPFNSYLNINASGIIGSENVSKFDCWKIVKNFKTKNAKIYIWIDKADFKVRKTKIFIDNKEIFFAYIEYSKFMNNLLPQRVIISEKENKYSLVLLKIKFHEKFSSTIFGD